MTLHGLRNMLHLTPSDPKELQAEIDALSKDIINADNVRVFLSGSGKEGFEHILNSVLSDVLLTLKGSTNQRERDEAVGKLKIFDDFQRKIQETIKKGDAALRKQSELKKKLADGSVKSAERGA